MSMWSALLSMKSRLLKPHPFTQQISYTEQPTRAKVRMTVCRSNTTGLMQACV